MQHKRVLMIAGDFVEDYEIMVAFQTMQTLAIEVDVVCPNKRKGEIIKTAIHDFEGDQTYSEKPGHNFMLNASFDSISLKDYDGLYLPGGRCCEYLRLNKEVLNFAKYFMVKSLPVAAICHGVQILAAANIIKNRTLTGYIACKPEVIMAGGNYIEIQPDKTVIDQNLVTSPAWPGNSLILREFAKMLGINVTYLD